MWKYDSQCSCTNCALEHSRRATQAMRTEAPKEHDSIETRHSFDVDHNFKTGKFYVIRLDGMPHYPQTPIGGYHNARECAAALVRKSGKAFAVISVVGICAPAPKEPIRPTVVWS